MHVTYTAEFNNIKLLSLISQLNKIFYLSNILAVGTARSEDINMSLIE